jgi:hypothetical protein
MPAAEAYKRGSPGNGLYKLRQRRETMKSKRLRKKPVLNKKTVANLKDDEMKKLKGGEIASTLPLISCVTTINSGG